MTKKAPLYNERGFLFQPVINGLGNQLIALSIKMTVRGFNILLPHHGGAQIQAIHRVGAAKARKNI